MAARLSYGTQLPVQSLSTAFAQPWEAGGGPAELVAVAQAADRLGFGYVAVCDHVAIPRRLAAAMGTTWYEPLTTLAFLAGQTEQVRLLTHVYVLALRHPLATAKAVATLDALSGGRLILGVGAGHVPEEFAALGVDFERRGAALDAALDAVDAALRSEFVGQPGRVPGPEAGPELGRGLGRELGQRPRPVQRPRPPIWVGGSSPAALRRAARYGDGWLPQGDRRAEMPGQIQRLRALRESYRPGEPIEIGAIAEPVHVGTPSWPVGHRCLTGKPEEVAEALRAYPAMGVGHLQVPFRSRDLTEHLDQLAAFATDVAPLLAAPS